MFKNRSITAFIGLVLAFGYAILVTSTVIGSNASAATDGEAVGAAIGTFLALPHIIIVWVGVIFGILGFFMRKVGFTLTAAILYASAAIVWLFWGWMLIPSIVLGFIGYADQKKINKR
jgi:hypothetical protein